MSELPEFLTPAQAARVLGVDETEVVAQMLSGGLRSEDGKIPRGDVEGMLVLRAMQRDPVELTDEDTDQLLPVRPCGACGERGRVRYVGSEVLEGSLEWYHVVHTEVNNHYRCGDCGATWHEFRML